MLTRSMLKVDGSELTVSHSILVGLDRLMVVSLWGDVIVRAVLLAFHLPVCLDIYIRLYILDGYLDLPAAVAAKAAKVKKCILN